MRSCGPHCAYVGCAVCGLSTCLTGYISRTQDPGLHRLMQPSNVKQTSYIHDMSDTLSLLLDALCQFGIDKAIDPCILLY